MKDLKKSFLNHLSIIFFLCLVFIFFYPIFLSGKIPIPADTIVGMYHPFRDNIWNNLSSGVPVKNPLITDPVRQQYVWRYLSIENLKGLTLPLWNPYSFSGTPLLANFQGASFYPLNILFLLLPFNLAWAILIAAEPLLAGLFLYLYLRYMKVSKIGSLIGGIVFAFSGFSTAWLTWNTVIQTVLWLPLILLAKEHLLKKLSYKWVAILIFAESSQILAGHLQLLFYALLISNLYLLIRILQLSFITHNLKKNLVLALKTYLPFIIIGFFVFFITLPQWFPTLQFITLSARNFDQGSWTKPGWFIPWQHLIQFIAPDFFGSPVTGNYWGQWNYGEFVGYIGLIPLLLALFAVLFRFDKKTLFFGSLALIALIFSLPTPLAKLPYELGIPFLSTSQPTRLIFIVDFSLSILAGLGFDQLIKELNLRKIFIILSSIGFLFFILWLFIFSPALFKISLPLEDISVAKRNFVLPTGLFVITALILVSLGIKKQRSYATTMIYIIVVIMAIDLLRFSLKFTPFSDPSWIFPRTKLIETMRNGGYWRFMALDRRIMPPNFSVYYHLQDIAGYDPLYIRRYGEFVAAWERGRPDISPASFNRILTPQDYSSPFAGLFGVKYILSLTDIKSSKLKLIDREGQTRLYENLDVLPRIFLVGRVIKANSDQDEIEKLYENINNLKQTAISQENINIINGFPLNNQESAKFLSYEDNQVKIYTQTSYARLLVLTDIYYPSWKVFIDGRQSKLYRVDYTLRGVLIPSGNHQILFKNTLF